MSSAAGKNTPGIWRPELRDCLALLLLAMLPAVAAGLWHPLRPGWSPERLMVTEVTIEEIARSPAPVLWVDARTAAAFREAHVPGAVLLNEDNWQDLVPDFLAEWSPGRRVVVYCNASGCQASQEVARRLRRELGLNHVFVLRGGWQSWRAAQK